ncbi:unnamed protein product [Clonostachys solani]|uniref:DUF3533 domain-containing protein n=1 Tax=Clonostachys solani TaxID=160281 RepID=A0A9N9ZHK3_9HYPO|nr:unnamed protein product [Clonostachys solani]
MGLLPPRSPGRRPLLSDAWAKSWPKVAIPIAMSALLLQLLFLGNLSYLFGALFRSGSRSHALKILAVDYDGGNIGKAMSAAYTSLEADTFPTLEFRSPEDYPSPDDLHNAVCKGGYWGAIYTHSGASDRLNQAVRVENTTVYNPAETISYTYNGVFFPTIASSVIDSSLARLVNVASRTYYRVARDDAAAVNMTDPVSSSVFLNPIQPSSDPIMPTIQGARALLNTVSMVFPALMQFFFLMGLNGIMFGAGIFANMSKRDVFLTRLVIGKVYTLVSALGTIGYIWAFRESWGVTTAQFFISWMALWLFMEVQYLVIDTMMESVVPLQFFAFFLVTWIITNIGSTVNPFELTAGFYRWGYALPARSTWILLLEIWSGGCRSEKEICLPVLFAWWLLGSLGSAWSVRQRCLLADQKKREKLESEGSSSS